MILWLHSQGYTYFSLPRLTYPEIKSLLDSRKREVERQKRESKKMERKADKMRRR